MLNEEELDSRYEVFIENYNKHIQIEGELGVDIAKTIILPAIINYQNKILNNISRLKELNVTGEESLRHQADKIGSCIEKINYKVEFLEKSLKNSYFILAPSSIMCLIPCNEAKYRTEYIGWHRFVCGVDTAAG